MMSSSINILCGFDDAYAPHFATMISSLFANCRNPDKIRIHIVSSLLSSGVRKRLDQIFTRYNAGAIAWLDVDCSRFVDAPVPRHFTRAAYARLAAFETLGEDRVVYLDVDLLCLADVAALYETDLARQPLAAVIDPNHTFCADRH